MRGTEKHEFECRDKSKLISFLVSSNKQDFEVKPFPKVQRFPLRY